MSFDYIQLEDILAIHTDQIARFGGSSGVRDLGLVEAALFRPQTGYYASLIEEAAALWESLSQNHPFIDGNKRTAFASTYVFLEINGYSITVPDHEVQSFVLGLYKEQSFEFEKICKWLIENTESLK